MISHLLMKPMNYGIGLLLAVLPTGPLAVITATVITAFVFTTAAITAAENPQSIHLSFGTEETVPVKAHGGVTRDQAGPRPPEFPDFSEGNTAVRLDGKGAYLSLSDPGPNSVYDFTNGDAITLEAWVKLDNIRDGQYQYIVGKGRTESPRFARDNQNWGMRVAGSGGEVKLNFLFASKPDGKSTQWHRWTSHLGFAAETGWHHIAVRYRFGEPDSIKGWIDGHPTDGTWDMNGPTRNAPVVDDDEVWIGTSMNRAAGASFSGWLDELAIHRTALDDKTIVSRFNRLGGARVAILQPEVMPLVENVPADQVLFTLAEGMPANVRWLHEGEVWPAPAVSWTGEEFLLTTLPQRYDAWGIRTAWNAPLLLRMSADVELPAGTQHLLLRARSMSRLWVDGKLVAQTAPFTKSPRNGEEPVTPVTEPPLPGLRPAAFHHQEVFGEVEIPGAVGATRRSRVVLEVVLGGRGHKTQTGEICVALRTPEGDSYQVLQPLSNVVLPLTNAAVAVASQRMEEKIQRLDDETRRQLAASRDPFWHKRHEQARQWTQENPAPPVPRVSGQAEQHPVDAFLQAKIQAALLQTSASDPQQTEHFYQQVLPILRENCFRCHGEKTQGGLKLNSREAALSAGDSEIPAVIPGDPDNSELIARIRSDDESIRMPPVGHGMQPEEIRILEHWVRDGAYWPAPPVTPQQVAAAPVINDEAFLRRVYLDLVGVPPTAAEAREFLTDNAPDKREQLIDKLLQQERMADHWISYWQDLLAENPSLLSATLNSSGPFRWYLHEALRDRKTLDRLVTELILMRGSSNEGGTAGFAVAGENDSPFAAKGHIIAGAFLGIELQCARCHDSPYHSTLQKDLYSLAAMLNRNPLTVPATSRVPAAFFEKKNRESLIKATLKPDEKIEPEWPFAAETGAVDGPEIDSLLENPKDSRERLAALVTAPQNERFSRVVVNRFWKQLMGAGIVEPANDWEGKEASHPELLDWLAHEFVASGYDINRLLRLLMTSQAYQREASGTNLTAAAELRFFNAPDRRRLTAEQIVDSLHFATGKSMDTGELTFNHDGRTGHITLGKPSRAWMLADLKNERDRPSLSLPQARTVTDVLEAFGWTGARQMPIENREIDPNVLQAGVLANGTLAMLVSRASWNSDLAELALSAESPQQLTDTLFLRILTRYPTTEERQAYVAALANGFAQRLTPADQIQYPQPLPRLPQVTWTNHLFSDANTIQEENERRVRQGPPGDPRLRSEWREVYEDAVWSLINHRDFVWVP